LVHTKPRQEAIALLNLQQQNYVCYLPMIPSQKLIKGSIGLSNISLFPRYLFIQLGLTQSAKSWSPIRSTRGVARLVSFGSEPAKVDENLIEALKAQEARVQGEPIQLFNRGERVILTHGAFAGIEGLYQMTDGDQRVIVLIEMMSKMVQIKLAPSELRKLS
jgi:transcriptional antiterminator RfaH